VIVYFPKSPVRDLSCGPGPKQPLIRTKEEWDRLDSLAHRANEDTQLRVRADYSRKRRARSLTLVLALALALVNSVLPVWGGVARAQRLMAVAPPVALTGFGLVPYAFFALAMAHVVSDFSLVNVVENSHSAKPLIYKITGVWSNHEDSMLLWVLVLLLFGAAVALFSVCHPNRTRPSPPRLRAGLGIARRAGRQSAITPQAAPLL
jgi:hypothetical protein